MMRVGAKITTANPELNVDIRKEDGELDTEGRSEGGGGDDSMGSDGDTTGASARKGPAEGRATDGKETTVHIGNRK